MKKRLLIPIYIILFSLLIGCINQSSSTKAPKFSAAELQQAEQIRNNLFTPGSVTIRGTIKGYNSKLGVKTYQLYYCNYFDDIHNSKTLDIDSLGHFEVSFDVPFTIGGCIVDSRDKWHNFIAQAIRCLPSSACWETVLSPCLMAARIFWNILTRCPAADLSLITACSVMMTPTT